MNFNKNNNENKIAQIRAKQQEKELEKIVTLADKKIGWIIFWSLFFPIGAYIYTGRWKAFFILLTSLFCLGVIVGTNSENEEEAFVNAFAVSSIITPIATLIDNISAINRSRNEVKKLS
jgi:ABC-type Fe3+ transport system permease subunit